MRKHRAQKSMKFVNVFIVVMMLAIAALFSSCFATENPGESQTREMAPAEVTTDKAVDNQVKNETDTADLHDKKEYASVDVNISDAVEDDQVSNEDVTDDISVDSGDKVGNGDKIKEFDVIKDMQLGALKIDMAKAEVEKVMKSELIDSTTNEEYGMETEIQTYKDGTVINLLNGKVYSISVKSPDYATPRGLKTGDTEETLRKLYGEPSAVEDGKWIYSSRGYDMFFVTVKNGVVVEIMISQVL